MTSISYAGKFPWDCEVQYVRRHSVSHLHTRCRTKNPDICQQRCGCILGVVSVRIPRLVYVRWGVLRRRRDAARRLGSILPYRFPRPCGFPGSCSHTESASLCWFYVLWFPMGQEWEWAFPTSLGSYKFYTESWVGVATKGVGSCGLRRLMYIIYDNLSWRQTLAVDLPAFCSVPSLSV